MHTLERRLQAGPKRPPAVVGAAWKRRAFSAWRHQLGNRDLVLFDRGRDVWRAFVVHADGETECVELLDLAETIDQLNEMYGDVLDILGYDRASTAGRDAA